MITTKKSLGSHSRVEINGIRFGVRGGSLVYRVETHDITNTESPTGDNDEPRTEEDPGRGQAELTLTGHRDKLVSPFATPLSLKAGERATVVVYADGLDYPADTLNGLLITEFRKEPIGDPAQPNGFSLTGRTGDYTEAE
jgi:hypothetical protein